MNSKKYYIYLLTNKNNRVLYTGFTGNLEKRIGQHQQKSIEGFTKKYNVNKLVYYEETNDVLSAIEREKEIKGWKREKKNKLINTTNPNWRDLSKE